LLRDIFGRLVEALVARLLHDQLAIDQPLQDLLAQQLAVGIVGNLDALKLGIELLQRNFLAIDDGENLALRLLVAAGNQKAGGQSAAQKSSLYFHFPSPDACVTVNVGASATDSEAGRQAYMVPKRIGER
jgi:hypothetical protein